MEWNFIQNICKIPHQPSTQSWTSIGILRSPVFSIHLKARHRTNVISQLHIYVAIPLLCGILLLTSWILCQIQLLQILLSKVLTNVSFKKNNHTTLKTAIIADIFGTSTSHTKKSTSWEFHTFPAWAIANSLLPNDLPFEVIWIYFSPRSDFHNSSCFCHGVIITPEIKQFYFDPFPLVKQIREKGLPLGHVNVQSCLHIQTLICQLEIPKQTPCCKAWKIKPNGTD